MKYQVLDCMDKWEWYTRAELQRLSGVSREKLNTALDELIDDGFLVEQVEGMRRKFGLAMTRPSSPLPPAQPQVEIAISEPGPVVGVQYRPAWTPLIGHDMLGHQRLCEESR